MRNRFFISNKLQHELEKDLKKREKIEDKIDKLQNKLDNEVNKGIKNHLEQFYDEVDNSTILSTFEYIEKNGSPNQLKILEDIKTRYHTSSLLIEDTFHLMDWYEKMCDLNDYTTS